ncbi:GntR family transcriptional regulator [Clostridium sp. 19966]|uniref:GntR family transcriptional regulator n=1 Tax=Clostridium sp. 19966 TaxID=2768166 RepID=UPI0028DD724F|nr:GntR family transcriptional regulator [Clostridium sp. 19966]MDT8719282.1 GntR family transcriptional regulator [Clostridium sp. 19966]
MYLKIDFDSEVPIYTQLRNQIVAGIASGELKDGDELPSVRQMASDIGINLHTVNKAYNVLKQEGFIRLDRRTGAAVSVSIEDKDKLKEKVENELEVVLTEAICKDISEDEIKNMVQSIYDKYRGGNL